MGLLMWNPLYGIFLFIAAINIKKDNTEKEINNENLKETKRDILDDLTGEKKHDNDH